MPRYTKAQAKNHEKALELIHSDKVLNQEEKEFILTHWLPGRDQSQRGAFFTPQDWAMRVASHSQCSTPATYVDLGAGIGALAYWLWAYLGWDPAVRDKSTIHCIEQSAEFIEVGQRVMPEAIWHHGNVLDPEIWAEIGAVDVALCNPPYKSSGEAPSEFFPYRGPLHFQFVAVAAQQASCGGIFILPSPMLPFKYDMSNPNAHHEYVDRAQYAPALQRLLDLYPGLTLACIPEWLSADFDGAKPNVNLVDVNTDEMEERPNVRS